ncbi:MAG: ABC transporter ATP-binding protein [Spirochaetes bacterium]|nr:ABC transporter ATP-binding protein [Spirochaetota bacterium]
MLELKEVSCFYGKVRALREVSIVVEEGSIVSLLGANGAGKMTCLKAISRIAKLQSGKIFFRGKDISNLWPADVVQLGLIQVPEGRMLFPQLTVEENLKMGACSRKDRKAIPADKERMYGYFPVLGQRRRQTVATLSGGEQQMLAIARGLMAAPKILLLDEPSLGLAPVIVEQIFAFIRDLKKTGTTVLLLEQNASMVLRIADRAYVLETGAIVMSGRASELVKSEKVRASYLGIGT